MYSCSHPQYEQCSFFIILPLPTLSRGFHKSRAGWRLWLSHGRRNRDTGLILSRVLFFSVALDAKKPRLQAKNLESRVVFIRCSVLFLIDSKSRKANFYYSSSILESCFLVVTGTIFRFGGVYFPLRSLCVFDYNENCCQNDVTASGGPLCVKRLDFLDGQPLSFGNFLIGQLAA